MEIYGITRNFPKSEIYGLISQFRRAGISVPANIAEGASRQTGKDYLHFLYIAKASLAEVEYYIHLSKRLGYINEDQTILLNNLTKKTASTLYGLIRAVEKES